MKKWKNGEFQLFFPPLSERRNFHEFLWVRIQRDKLHIHVELTFHNAIFPSLNNRRLKFVFLPLLSVDVCYTSNTRRALCRTMRNDENVKEFSVHSVHCLWVFAVTSTSTLCRTLSGLFAMKMLRKKASPQHHCVVLCMLSSFIFIWLRMMGDLTSNREKSFEWIWILRTHFIQLEACATTRIISVIACRE